MDRGVAMVAIVPFNIPFRRLEPIYTLSTWSAQVEIWVLITRANYLLSSRLADVTLWHSLYILTFWLRH